MFIESRISCRPFDSHVKIYLLDTADERISSPDFVIKKPTTTPNVLQDRSYMYKIDRIFYNNVAVASVVRTILKDNCSLSADPCRPQPVVPPTPPSRRCNDAFPYVERTHMRTHLHTRTGLRSPLHRTYKRYFVGYRLHDNLNAWNWTDTWRYTWH